MTILIFYIKYILLQMMMLRILSMIIIIQVTQLITAYDLGNIKFQKNHLDGKPFGEPAESATIEVGQGLQHYTGTTVDQCKNYCQTRKTRGWNGSNYDQNVWNTACLYYSWSSKHGEFLCYLFSQFGGTQNFMAPFLALDGTDLHYTTYANCENLFQNFLVDTVVSNNYLISTSGIPGSFVYDPDALISKPGQPDTDYTKYPQKESGCPTVSSVSFTTSSNSLALKRPDCSGLNILNFVECRTMSFPLDQVADHTYTYIYTFSNSGTKKITGKLSVVACPQGNVPSGYLQRQTIHSLSSGSITQSLKYDPWPVESNANCTVNSYAFNSINGAGLIEQNPNCQNQMPQVDASCLELLYPISLARFVNGNPSALTYSFIVKFINGQTNTYQGKIEIYCTDQLTISEPNPLTKSVLSLAQGSGAHLVIIEDFTTDQSNCPPQKYIATSLLPAKVFSQPNCDRQNPVDSLACKSVTIQTDETGTFSLSFTVSTKYSFGQTQVSSTIQVKVQNCTQKGNEVVILPPFVFANNSLYYDFDTGIQSIMLNEFQTNDSYCPIQKYEMSIVLSRGVYQTGCNVPDTSDSCRIININTINLLRAKAYFIITAEGGQQKIGGPINLQVVQRVSQRQKNLIQDSNSLIHSFNEHPQTHLEECTHQQEHDHDEAVVLKCQNMCLIDCLLDHECNFISRFKHVIGEQIQCQNIQNLINTCGVRENANKCVYKCVDNNIESLQIHSFSATSQKKVALKNFQQIFPVALQSFCQIHFCILRQADCLSNLTSSNIFFRTSKTSSLQISLIQNNTQGWNESICIYCQSSKFVQMFQMSFNQTALAKFPQSLDFAKILYERAEKEEKGKQDNEKSKKIGNEFMKILKEKIEKTEKGLNMTLKRIKLEKSKSDQLLQKNETMVWISEITNQYDITIKFLKEMRFPDDLKYYYRSYFSLELLEPEREERAVNQKTDGFQRSLKENNGIDLKYEWIIKDYNNTSIQIKMIFKKPDYVSRSGQKNAINLEFLKPENFTTMEGEPLRFDKYWKQNTIELELPKFLSLQDQKVIKSVTQAIDLCVNYTSKGAVVSLLLGGALQQLWGLLRGIQFTTNLSLIEIQYPANAKFFLQNEMQIAAMDVYGGQQIISKFFTFSNYAPFDDHFNNLQIGDMNFLTNSSSTIFPIFIIMVVFQILANSLHQLMIKYHTYKFARYLGPIIESKQANFKERILTFFLEQFYTLVFCCHLSIYNMLINHENFRKMFFTSFSDTFQTILTFVFSLVLIYFIIVHIYIHVRYQRNTENKKRQISTHFSSFYEGIKLNKYATFQQLIYLTMRYIVVWVYMIPMYNFVQILFVIVTVLAGSAFVARQRPFIDRETNRNTLINYITSLIIIYGQISLTTGLANPEAENAIGFSIITILVLNLAYHFGNILFCTVKSLIHRFTRLYNFAKNFNKQKEHFQNIQKINNLFKNSFLGLKSYIIQNREIQKVKDWQIIRKWMDTYDLYYDNLDEEIEYQKRIKIMMLPLQKQINLINNHRIEEHNTLVQMKSRSQFLKKLRTNKQFRKYIDPQANVIVDGLKLIPNMVNSDFQKLQQIKNNVLATQEIKDIIENEIKNFENKELQFKNKNEAEEFDILSQVSEVSFCAHSQEYFQDQIGYKGISGNSHSVSIIISLIYSKVFVDLEAHSKLKDNVLFNQFLSIIRQIINFNVGNENYVPTMILDDLKELENKLENKPEPMEFLESLILFIEPFVNSFDQFSDPFGRFPLSDHEKVFKISNKSLLSKHLAWLVLESFHCSQCKVTIRKMKKLLCIPLEAGSISESIQSLVQKEFSEDKKYEGKYFCESCKRENISGKTIVWNEPIAVPLVAVIQLKRKINQTIKINDVLKISKIQTLSSDIKSDNFQQEQIDNKTKGPFLDYALRSIICQNSDLEFYIFSKKQVSQTEYKWFKYLNGTMIQQEPESVRQQAIQEAQIVFYTVSRSYRETIGDRKKHKSTLYSNNYLRQDLEGQVERTTPSDKKTDFQEIFIQPIIKTSFEQLIEKQDNNQKLIRSQLNIEYHKQRIQELMKNRK